MIPGGSGQVGTVLARAFRTMTRCRDSYPSGRADTDGATSSWDARTLGDWTAELSRRFVINLAGKSVNCRTRQNRERSRVPGGFHESSGQRSGRTQRPPRLWFKRLRRLSIRIATMRPTTKPWVFGGNEENVPETWRFSIGVGRRGRAPSTKRRPCRSHGRFCAHLP